MRNIATIATHDREDLFHNTAAKMGINEPWEERSNTKQDIFNKEANTRAEVFLRDTFLPSLHGRQISQALDFFLISVYN